MTNHAIIAADWQLQAADKGRLKAIILPLLPEPKEEAKTWFWPCEPVNLFWFKSEGVGERLLKRLAYQQGDRIYLAEKWVSFELSKFGESKYWGKSKDYAEGNVDEDYPSMDGFLPAQTMPPEAAQYWFEVTGVLVVQMNRFTASNLQTTNMGSIDPHPGNFTATENWNAAYPDHPWDSDRWVVVLNVTTFGANASVSGH
jgi:hypothetical protein